MNTYTSTEWAQADGKLYAPGSPFVTSAPAAEAWTPVSTGEKAAAEASGGMGGGDAPLEALPLAALQAIAVEKHVNPNGLKKPELITAIKAANEPAL